MSKSALSSFFVLTHGTFSSDVPVPVCVWVCGCVRVCVCVGGGRTGKLPPLALSSIKPERKEYHQFEIESARQHAMCVYCTVSKIFLRRRKRKLRVLECP